MKKACEHCIYWTQEGSYNTGLCRYMPQSVFKPAEEWCGQFTAKVSEQPIVAEPIKKRGRPKGAKNKEKRPRASGTESSVSVGNHEAGRIPGTTDYVRSSQRRTTLPDDGKANER